VLNGLDLFSGIGGLTLALRPWVRPVVYCENNRYAQHVLLSRMQSGELPAAPIWDDVSTLRARDIPDSIDVIAGGFPCQDISAAGRGKGLDGERSGLFREIVRLVEEANPRLVFLENVPAIRTRGLDQVIQAFTDLRYDCRWTRISAASVGAPHLRERWFLLAHARSVGSRNESRGSGRESREGVAIDDGKKKSLADSEGCRLKSLRHESDAEVQRENGTKNFDYGSSQNNLANTEREGSLPSSLAGVHSGEESSRPRNEQFSGRCPVVDAASFRRREGWSEHEILSGRETAVADASWWAIEPDVGRVANGVPARVDRIKGLGNSVVPLQAQVAFEKLIGLGGVA